jgi:hypothetical protein
VNYSDSQKSNGARVELKISIGRFNSFTSQADSDVIVSMPVSKFSRYGFNFRSWSSQDYKIGICCFSAKHSALRRKSKDWLVRKLSNFSAISWREQINFRFVLDQHAELDFYSASSLKQQSAGRHVAPLGHISFVTTLVLHFDKQNKETRGSQEPV